MNNTLKERCIKSFMCNINIDNRKYRWFNQKEFLTKFLISFNLLQLIVNYIKAVTKCDFFFFFCIQTNLFIGYEF